MEVLYSFYTKFGGVSYVMKNYPDQPLRPMVAVIGADRVYDLSWDLSCLNIVIVELLEDKKFNRTLINM